MALWRKPAPPTVIGVLTTPPPSSWWKTNRHLVLLGLGLAAGFWIAVHTGAAASPATCPTPAPTTSATASTLVHVPPAKGAKR